MLSRYPNRFSGGQRQRISIARARARSRVLICDEGRLRTRRVGAGAGAQTAWKKFRPNSQPAILFITHDLRAAPNLRDRVLVMQHGVVVEQGITRDVFLRTGA